MDWYWVLLIALVMAGGGGFLGYTYRKNMVEEKIHRTEEHARRLYDDAAQKAEEIVRKAEETRKEKMLEAKEEILKAKAESDRQRQQSENELRERRAEVQRSENRVLQREEALDKKADNLEAREEALSRRQMEIQQAIADAEALKEQQKTILQDLEAEKGRQEAELQRVASMTTEEARQIIIDRVTRQAYHDAAAEVRRIEQQTKTDADKRAREIITTAIQRCASDHVAEITVSTVALPSDDMKGRIIGREGRNIRALETATGVDFIIDDTPDSVTVSCFDPVRREIARTALEHLVSDGRIHPGQIETLVEKAKREVETRMHEAGENAVFETGVNGLHPELVNTLGRLRYRTSYGQNVLQHSIEVSHLCGMMAAELGADVALAKRAGLLHDIGKAVDHEKEQQGTGETHVTLGAELARKYHESPAVIHCIMAHHNDVEPETVEAVLVQAADAISAARPGARRESLENYIKRLEKLEEICTSFDGVEKCYAIQSGREVRVMVKPDDVTDDGIHVLAREIVDRIEKEMTYPGQIRVNVIRENRAMEVTKK